jgi:hypothetical protein
LGEQFIAIITDPLSAIALGCRVRHSGVGVVGAWNGSR